MKKSSLQNDPTRKGQLAARKETFGPFHRYAVAPVHTRFDELQWFVWDAEVPDEEGRPSVIRQEFSREAAVEGLE